MTELCIDCRLSGVTDKNGDPFCQRAGMCINPKTAEVQTPQITGVYLPPLKIYNPNGKKQEDPVMYPEPGEDILPEVVDILANFYDQYIGDDGTLSPKQCNSKEFRRQREILRKELKLTHGQMRRYAGVIISASKAQRRSENVDTNL